MEVAALRRVSLLATLAAIGAFLTAGAPPAAASTSCDLVAANNGSDSAPGSVSQPLLSVQRLADSLQPGQTGCLRNGVYTDSSDDEVTVETPAVTLTSYPGERATVRARLWVKQTADGVTISNLNLDGRSPRELPSPTINADDVILRDNDITNYHTAICVSLGSPDTWGRAHRTLVEGNKIHDCGNLPATNQDHGIYVNSSDDAVIRDNWIYDNADRGVQLYADAQHTTITGNVIDGNGQGVIFGGSEATASNNNVVENNVITNSKIRDNIESSWGGAAGTGNIARNNCVGGGAYDDGDGGILGTYPGGLGFRAVDNIIHVPDFADPAHGDFTIPADDPCAALLGGTPADDVPGQAGVSTGITIEANRRSVKRMRPVRISGRARGTETVAVMTFRRGEWRRLGRASLASDGRYRLNVRLRNPGRLTLKAAAVGTQASAKLRLRVRRS